MAVLPLLLGGEENAFLSLLAPLLLREMNGRRGCGMKHRTLSAVVLFITSHLNCFPSLNCWTNLACELTEQTQDDRPRIVDMN